MQQLGEDAKYIKISGNGHNALDFHIAYYIGEIAVNDPSAKIHIISKDKGFDPLIEHLESKGVKIQRLEDLAEIPVLRVESSSSTEEKIAAIVKNLKNRGQSRPRKVKTLKNTINNLFTKKLDDNELQKLVDNLQTRKHIKIEDGMITYNLKKSN